MYSQEAEDAITRNTPPTAWRVCESLPVRGVTPRVIHPTYQQLAAFTHAELREYAAGLGVQACRGKSDTIMNLLESGRARMCATLGD